MRTLILIIIFLQFFAYHGLSQTFDNFKTIDEYTYRYYTEQKWDSLIYVSKHALKSKIDYYYLRMRAGIAFYELKKYRKATEHFEKALYFNSTDEIAMEYLYFGYLYSGKNEQAKALIKKFPDNLKEKLNLNKSKLIDEIYIEGGPTLGNNPPADENNNTNILLREQNLTRDMRYVAVGLKHTIFKNLTVFHSISSIDIGKRQLIQVYNGSILNDYRIYQRQYYINSTIYLGKGITFTPAFHVINVNFDKLNYSFTANKKLILYQEKKMLKDYAASVALAKDIGIFDISLLATYSKLNNNYHKQGGFMVTIFPLNNLDLYFTSTFFYQQSTKNNLIAEQLIGYKLLPKLWIDVFYTLGHLNNFVEKNAFIVYNIDDKILSRKSFSLLFVVNKNIELSLRYLNMTKENIIKEINNKNHLNTFDNTFNNHLILGGIKWKL
ncbi:MAG: hypothetical protein WC868_10120 [Bacteroidales bacterium]